MSSPNQARRVTAQIFFQGADITGSMRPYFLSATYTDKEADGTDDLQLKLQDRDDIWLKKWLADAIDAAASAGSLSASSKAKTDGAAKSYKVTAKSGLNVRSGPSTSYGKYGALVCGAELQVEGIENGWAKVSYNGKTAYVSASYIKESGGGGGDASAAAPASASGAGFKISKSALTLVAEVPNLDQATFDKLAEAAEKGCPVSKLLNAEITLHKTLK